MNFISIDFETANEKRCSPCSLGITIVENNKIVEEKYWLIKPKEMRFQAMNIWIHGIHPEDVEDEKEFDELWPELLPYFENNLIVAHNASFDVSVLRNTLDLYNIEFPSLKYCCTMLMSKNFFNYLDDSKLSTVSNHLEYSFNHHNASADASACANILIKIIDELKIKQLDELTSSIGIKLGSLFKDGYIPCKNLGSNLTSSRKNLYLKSTMDSLFDSNSLFFKNKVVVFTGPLSSMSRIQASSLIRKLGGSTGSSVTKKTDILVIGFKNIQSLNFNQMSSKLRRAIDLECNGQNIVFLNEEEFLDVLKNPPQH